MTFYNEVGVRPFINAGGWPYTRYGGSIMPDAVVAAMAEASKRFVNIYELQDGVGKAVAALTHNEAGFISCGAASGILLCAGAAIAGTDPEKSARLPDSAGLPNQFIMPNPNRGTEADSVIQAAGGRLVLVGPPDRRTTPEEILAAINNQTAAILLVQFEFEGDPYYRAIIDGSHARKIPVFIDGACAVPPKTNLWHFTRDLGADAFITSGGKSIRGPQTTGIVLGKHWVIEACKFHAFPNLRIGRGMKVGKEEFAGIFTALKLFLQTDEQSDHSRQQKVLESMAENLKDLPGARVTLAHGPELRIQFDPHIVKLKTDRIAALLHKTDPSILLSGRDDKLTVRAGQLQADEDKIVIERLRQVIREIAMA
jgi:uncharacterized pyridoxal phosphate-dependent enzyme